MTKKPVDELEVRPLIKDALRQNVSSWKEHTYDSRTSELRKFDAWLDRTGYDVTEIEPKHVLEFISYLDEEGYAPGTIESYFGSVRILYNELAGILGEMDHHPVEDLLEYKKKSEIIPNGNSKHDELERVYLEEDEVMKLAENVPAPRVRNELLVKLLFQTGVRASELSEITLRRMDRSTDPPTIRIENKKKINPDPENRFRTVVYHPERNGVGSLMRLWLDGGRREALSKYAENSEYLFVSERAEQVPADRITRIVRRAAENAGLQEEIYRDQRGHKQYRVTAHSLRHSHAVYALRSGIDVRTLQKHMGHESIDMTEKYLKIVSDDVEQTFDRRWGVTEQ